MKLHTKLYKLLFLTTFIVLNSVLFMHSESICYASSKLYFDNNLPIKLSADSSLTDVSISDGDPDNSSANMPLDNINCKSCILMEQNSGLVLYEKNSSEKLYPASTTKIVTALLVLDKCNLNDMVTVSHYAIASVPETYSVASLKAGESFTVRSLLYTLMIGSANDSAFVLAEYVANGGNNYPIDDSEDAKIAFNNSISTFSNMMNNLAKEIGCTSTNFVNPNGIHNENHYSTAYDLSLIGKYASKNSILMDIVKMESFTLPATEFYKEENRTCKCTNHLLYKNSPSYYEYATGLKTGYTDPARFCIVATAKKNDVSLVVVVLGADNLTDPVTSREAICKTLFEYGFNNYSYYNLINSGDVATSFTIINGDYDTKSLNLIVKDDIMAFLKTDGFLDITPDIKIKKFLAPIAKDTVVGSITYNIDGISYSSDLLASHDVYSASYMNFILGLLGSFLILLLLFVIIFRKK